jgi:hypothetical protein
MKLARNWRDILLRAWSTRFMVLAAVFGALEAAMPYLQGTIPVSQGVFALLTSLATLAAFVSRIVYQEGLSAPDPEPEPDRSGEPELPGL